MDAKPSDGSSYLRVGCAVRDVSRISTCAAAVVTTLVTTTAVESDGPTCGTTMGEKRSGAHAAPAVLECLVEVTLT